MSPSISGCIDVVPRAGVVILGTRTSARIFRDQLLCDLVVTVVFCFARAGVGVATRNKQRLLCVRQSWIDRFRILCVQRRTPVESDYSLARLIGGPSGVSCSTAYFACFSQPTDKNGMVRIG